jgi:hypothetical protein
VAPGPDFRRLWGAYAVSELVAATSARTALAVLAALVLTGIVRLPWRAVRPRVAVPAGH